MADLIFPGRGERRRSVGWKNPFARRRWWVASCELYGPICWPPDPGLGGFAPAEKASQMETQKSGRGRGRVPGLIACWEGAWGGVEPPGGKSYKETSERKRSTLSHLEKGSLLDSSTAWSAGPLKLIGGEWQT